MKPQAANEKEGREEIIIRRSYKCPSASFPFYQSDYATLALLSFMVK